MYASQNFKTKKALKEAVAAYLAAEAEEEGSGTPVTIFAPGLGFPKENGNEALEGPWYPEPHRWYASVIMKDGRVVKVK